MNSYSIMSGSTTSIAELPENITAQVQPLHASQPTTQQQIPQQMQGNVTASQQYPQNQGGPVSEGNYAPINIHPNPYGTPVVGPDQIPLPEASPQKNTMHATGPPQYTNDLSNIPPQALPSRDIPSNTTNYTQDVHVQPNYVPQPKLTSDYIREYEQASENSLQKHEQNKHREEVAQDLFSSLQIPIFVGILYFVFQMPIVNTMLRKYFTFLSIYHDDGNFNFMGLLLKSVLFASLFYMTQLVSQKISDL